MLWCAATIYKHFDRGGKSVAALYDLVASGLDRPTIARPLSEEKPAKKSVEKKTAVKKAVTPAAAKARKAPRG